MDGIARYGRQLLYKGIGPEGQRRLGGSRVAVVGLGALGSVIAESLARAGIGFLRLVDRDRVELVNLHRQTLYDEEDAREGLAKPVAAARRLGKVNSEIVVEPVVADFNPATASGLVEGVDLVLDGTDNIGTRLAINDECLRRRLPWIYGGAVMDSGMTMNVIPGETPCFRCLCPELPPQGVLPTTAVSGIIGMASGIIALVEAAEAVKILLGDPMVRKTLFVLDVWKGRVDLFPVERLPDCPACSPKAATP